ncbi:MAG: aldolase catalytic domain-containing protein [Oscillospiraceae bacterium]|nr:aldolase catalytic domain-containing protein [Oscillospiraceae bacterium]
MVNSRNRLLLDCTLRDGGYVNNWEFDTSTALHICDALYVSGVRYIELGLVGRGGVPGKTTKFSSFDEIKPLLKDRRWDCRYCVMITQAELSASRLEIPPRGETTVDMIRIAYFKAEEQDALSSAYVLKKKGYEVFLQAMATFMYTEDELSAMLEKVNRIQPAAFYIVDSFSTMYNDDVRQMADFVLTHLEENILFGFHAHNNIQMAYSNAITFMNMQTERTLIIDGSIFGMGRGAGNVPLELLMEYANKKLGGHYDISAVLTACEQYIAPIFKENYWGYSIPYLLTASNKINSVYGWYLRQKGITTSKDINTILERIPENLRYTLARDTVDRVIADYFEEKSI